MNPNFIFRCFLSYLSVSFIVMVNMFLSPWLLIFTLFFSCHLPVWLDITLMPTVGPQLQEHSQSLAASALIIKGTESVITFMKHEFIHLHALAFLNKRFSVLYRMQDLRMYINVPVCSHVSALINVCKNSDVAARGFKHLSKAGFSIQFGLHKEEPHGCFPSSFPPISLLPKCHTLQYQHHIFLKKTEHCW